MTTRPSLDVLWAQDALPDNIGDADTYVPANPAYPEQKPNQYSAGWSVTGKTVVKQPHQWINSWYQSVDWRLMEWYARNFAWQPEITYAAGAVITVSNLRYVALSANSNKPPATNPAIWARAMSTSQPCASACWTRALRAGAPSSKTATQPCQARRWKMRAPIVNTCNPLVSKEIRQ